MYKTYTKTFQNSDGIQCVCLKVRFTMGFTTTAFVERDIYVFDHWILGWGFVTMDDKNPGSSPA